MEILTNCNISIFIIIISISISVYSFIRLKLTHEKLKCFKNYKNSIEILNDDILCFKHDFDNIVTTIGGYISSDDMVGLKDYYTNLECDCKNVNNLYILNPKVVNNCGVYNLLIDKFKKAKNANIKMNFNLFLDMKYLKMNTYEFSRILGILLDNALEAAKDSIEKIINIHFKSDEKNNRQLIIIENTYKNKNVNINNIFKKDATSKNNHQGLGLFEVKKILSRHSNLNLFTSKNEIFFIQQLEIYYK